MSWRVGGRSAAARRERKAKSVLAAAALTASMLLGNVVSGAAAHASGRGAGDLPSEAQAAGGAAVAAARDGRDFTLHSFRWQAAVTSQATVTATNEWGDIRVRTAQRGGVAVSAMIQRIGTTAEELAVRVDEGEDAVRVAVVPLVAAPRGRVDLTLMVPAGMRLEVATRDGVAEVKHKGDVVVRTVGGAVTLLTPGHASVETSSGDVEAKLTAKGWERPVTIASDSGDVTLWLPTDAAATLEAEAGGGAEVTRPPAPPGQSVRVASRTGAVRVLAYVEPRPATAPGNPVPAAELRSRQ